MYVVYIKGDNVFGNFSNQYIIDSLELLPTVRKKLRYKYGIEFGENVSRINTIQIHNNITNDLDVSMVVEPIEYIKEQE